MISANLHGADLSNADLENANLGVASLSDADLRGANLSGADLRQAIDLTQDQLDKACGDNVKLDRGLTVKPCRK
jgi:uncharacterized protein YjbI with pentapeptide repeats